MEHIIVTALSKGYFRLTPEEGYQLYNIRTRQFYSEAVVKEKDFKNWRAVSV
jgi:hypothetical protein